MARVKRGTTAHARHKKVTDKAKGYYGRRKNVFRVAVQAVEKAGQYAYRDRKVLSDLAISEPASFKGLVEKAQAALA